MMDGQNSVTRSQAWRLSLSGAVRGQPQSRPRSPERSQRSGPPATPAGTVTTTARVCLEPRMAPVAPKPKAVVMAVDAAHFPAAVFLVDRLQRLNPPDDVEIVLFSDSPRDLQAAAAWGGLRCRLRLFTPPVKFYGSGHISGATFYRIYLPALTGAKRVLYLDNDIYPERETIWRLLDLDMKGHAIAAVRDVMAVCWDTPVQREELVRARRTVDRRYLNAGVLLIDAHRYAAERLQDRFFDVIRRGGYHDQAAINLTLAGNWLDISPAFNTIPLEYLAGLPQALPPVITHFQGTVKPWHGPLFYLDHRARPEIETFLRGTPWAAFVARHVDPARVERRDFTPPTSFVSNLHRFLSSTSFADVEQGITASPIFALPDPAMMG